jgi:hypothetical protein
MTTLQICLASVGLAVVTAIIGAVVIVCLGKDVPGPLWTVVISGITGIIGFMQQEKPSVEVKTEPPGTSSVTISKP